ncbi:MAG: extracellular solute-binding protein [Clostridia bacterium]|nr:extracellular solute-binding protein [Clostridia bacterium]
MTKRSKKALSVVMALSLSVAMAFGAVGCGGDSSTSSNTSTEASASTASTETKEPELKPVTINLSEQDDAKTVDPTWAEVVKEFMQKYPTVTVKTLHNETEGQRTDWQNSVAAGAGPEIISCPNDNVGLFATANTAMELDNFFSKEFFATLRQEDVDGFRMNGKLYAIPYKTGNALALIYNKKYVTKVPETMDELIEQSKAFTKDGNYGLVFNMAEPFFFIPLLGGFDGKVFDDKEAISLNTEAMKKTAQFMYDLKYTHKIVPKEANYDVANGLFKDGKAAFIFNGPWVYSEYAEKKIDFGIAKIPKTSDGKYPQPYTGAKVFMVNPNIKDENTKLAVKKFLEFVNSAPIQLKLAKVTAEFPTNLEAFKDPSIASDERMKALGDQMSVGTPMPIRPEMRAVWDAMRPVFVEVMAGKTKPEDAPAKMQTQAEKLASEQLGN